MADFEKYEVALELLESALSHYYDSDSYFSALHCAGAAEEILGKYVSHYGGQSSYESTRASLKKLAYGLSKIDLSNKEINELLNGTKNNTKHGIGTINVNSQASAAQMLERAIQNYNLLLSHIELKEIKYLSRFETRE